MRVEGGKMPNIRKIIQKMRQQPNGIRFLELARVLESNGYTMKKSNGTSHRNFINQKGDVITIKMDNPVKAVYVKDVLKRISKEDEV